MTTSGEGVSGAPGAGAVWPVVSSTSQAKAARLKPLSVQVSMFIVGWMVGGTPESSFVDVAIGQASVSASLAPSIARGATLEELPPQERLAPLEVGAGMSRSLVWVAAFDDAA